MTDVKSPFNKEQSETILKIFLEEMGRDGQVDNREKVYFEKLFPCLEISPERFKLIKKKILTNQKPDSQAGTLNLKLLFRRLLMELGRQLPSDLVQKSLFYIAQTIDCNGEFSNEQLQELINETKPGPQPKNIHSNRKMDSDCYRLLTEISEKNWENELDDFRTVIINTEIENEVDSKLKKLQEENMPRHAIIGAVIGTILALLIGGKAAFALSLAALIAAWPFLILMFGPAGFAAGLALLPLGGGLALLAFKSGGIFLSIILPILSGSSIGALAGVVVGMKLKRSYWSQRHQELGQKVRDRHHDYILSPQDLLRFWEIKLEIFLHDKKAKISNKIREASAGKTECLKLESELTSKEDQEMALQLSKRAYELDDVLQDAKYVSSVLQKLEDRFIARIEELKVLVTRQRELERAAHRKVEIKVRAQKILGQTDQAMDKWEDEKEQLQVEINGMMSAFHNQLLHTRDFIDAEIELSHQPKQLNDN